MADHSDRDFDKKCIEGIHNRDENAFKLLFMKYYSSMCSIAADYIESYDIGKEVAQEVLLNIWERGKDWQPHGPLKSYLYHAVCKKSLNYIKQDQRRRNAMQRFRFEHELHIVSGNEETEKKELVQQIWKLVKKLPKQRQIIFILQKRHGLTYRQVAEIMEISTKTVENQMGRALKFLREELKSSKYL